MSSRDQAVGRDSGFGEKCDPASQRRALGRLPLSDVLKACQDGGNLGLQLLLLELQHGQKPLEPLERVALRFQLGFCEFNFGHGEDC